MFLFVVLGGPLPSKLNALVIYVPTKMAKRTKAVGSHPLPSELNLYKDMAEHVNFVPR